jgi:hypothetical protein
VFTEVLLRTGMRSIEGKRLRFTEPDDLATAGYIAGDRIVLPGAFTKADHGDFEIPITPRVAELLERARWQPCSRCTSSKRD